MLGGILAERADWRWIFWFLAIMSGLCLLFILVFLPETARRIVGNGNIAPSGINRSLMSLIRGPKHDPGQNEGLMPASAMINPLGCLRIICHRDTALILFANAIFYMNYSCMQASLSPLLMDIYTLNALQVGLAYLPYGIACGLASYIVGKHPDLHQLGYTDSMLGKSAVIRQTNNIQARSSIAITELQPLLLEYR